MWKIRKGYLELDAPQKSSSWFLNRRRVTASNVEKILGLSTFGTKQDAIQEIIGSREKSFSPEEQRRMDLGNEMEPYYRKLHEKVCGYPITEPSLCISLRWFDIPFGDGYLSDKYPSILKDPLHPNWFIGGSPDGIIHYPDHDENLELKYTEKGYNDLYVHHETGDYFPRYTPGKCTAYENELIKHNYNARVGAIDYFSHIWRSHYFQMQTCMAITQNNNCHYGVGSPGKYYTEVVPFDFKYWTKFLYPALIDVIENELKPVLSSDFKTSFANEIKNIIELNPKETVVPVYT